MTDDDLGDATPGAIRDVVTRLFRVSNVGIPLGEYLREVMDVLLDIAGSGSVALRIDDWVPATRCRAIRGARTPYRFQMERYVRREGAAEADEPVQERLCRALLRGVQDGPNALFTERGGFWTPDARACRRFTLEPEGDIDVGEWAEAGNFRSLVLVPLSIAGPPSGFVQVIHRHPNRFGRSDVRLIEDVAGIVGVALAQHHANWKLRQRVKELTCLNGIARVADRPGVPMSTVLQEIARLLPPGWQYPECCAARIVLDGERYETPGFVATGNLRAATIAPHRVPRGRVEVAYASAPSGTPEIPFLEEEETLLGEVALQVARIVESRENEREQMLLRAQLRHADRLGTIGKLATGVARELSEPIGNILGFAEFIQASEGLPVQVTQDMERIHRAALHAREAIRKMMFFARQTPQGKVALDLNVAVEEAVGFLRPRLAREAIVLVMDLGDGLPSLAADPAQLQQVIIDLLLNAIQSMPEGGRLTLTTSADAERVCLEVRDTGCGIPEDILPQVFVPFFTTRDDDQGAGLGLSVVQSIVSDHGGTVTVESQPGAGSVFRVRLATAVDKSWREGEE